MATSNLSHVPLPDITLPEIPLLGFHTDTMTTSANPMPYLPDITLPNSSEVPSMVDDAGTLDQRNVVQSEDTQSGKLQGPEADAQTLGDFKTCTMCNIYLNSKVQADMHYAGKLHQKKLRQKAMAESADLSSAVEMTVPISAASFSSGNEPVEKGICLRYCDTCGLTLTGMSQVKMHLSGARHAKKLRQLAQKKKLEEVIQDEEQVKPEEEPEAFYCKYCDKVCTSQLQLDQHFTGYKHKNVMAAAKCATNNRFVIPPDTHETPVTTSIYVCPTCNVTTNSEQQYLQHCGGASHKDMLEQPVGRGNARHQPYPMRRGGSFGRGRYNNNNQSNSNWPTWGNNKLKGGSDSFSKRGSFVNSRGNSYRPSRGRGSRGGQFNQSQYNSSNSSFGNGQGTDHSAKLGNFGDGYDRGAMGMNRGNASANHAPQRGGRGGRGRGWQGNWN